MAPEKKYAKSEPTKTPSDNAYRKRFQNLCVCLGLADAVADDANEVGPRAPKSL
jgi:hypothetical protein